MGRGWGGRQRKRRPSPTAPSSHRTTPTTPPPPPPPRHKTPRHRPAAPLPRRADHRADGDRDGARARRHPVASGHRQRARLQGVCLAQKSGAFSCDTSTKTTQKATHQQQHTNDNTPTSCISHHIAYHTTHTHTPFNKTSFHRPNLIFRVVPKYTSSADGDGDAPCLDALVKCGSDGGAKRGGKSFGLQEGAVRGLPRITVAASGPQHPLILPKLSSPPSHPPRPLHTHTPPPPQTPTTTRTRPRSFVRAQGAASGIVYCLSRAEAEGVAQHLRDAGRVSAAHYHAGMSHKQRTEVQNAWQDGRATVIVATIAFGARGLVVLFLRGRACLLFCPAPGGSGAGLRCATSNMHTQQHTTTRYYTQHQQLCHAFTKTSTQPPSTPAHLQHQPTTTTRQLLQKT